MAHGKRNVCLEYTKLPVLTSESQILRCNGVITQQMVPVIDPAGGETFAHLPHKFRNTIFIRQGQYVICAPYSGPNPRITCAIQMPIDSHHLRTLRNDPFWPSEWRDDAAAAAGSADNGNESSDAAGEAWNGENPNRRELKEGGSCSIGSEIAYSGEEAEAKPNREHRPDPLRARAKYYGRDYVNSEMLYSSEDEDEDDEYGEYEYYDEDEEYEDEGEESGEEGAEGGILSNIKSKFLNFIHVSKK